jgi:SAM-dependent methyltransferase
MRDATSGGTGGRALSHDEARRVYDRIGAWQDSQAFYEDRAVGLLLRHADFESAARVFEFGCGTGRFAEGLLSRRLAPTATYQGVDLSPRMVALARERLAPWAARARVRQSDGSPPDEEPAASCDRFVSNFVLDLLSEEDIASVLRAAHRMLEPNGLLCLVGLTPGKGRLARLVSRAWSGLHALRPALVGGCRPLELQAWVRPPDWEILRHERVASFGVTSEVVVARPRS